MKGLTFEVDVGDEVPPLTLAWSHGSKPRLTDGRGRGFALPASPTRLRRLATQLCAVAVGLEARRADAYAARQGPATGSAAAPEVRA